MPEIGQMVDLKIRRRNRLRRKEVDTLATQLDSIIGCKTFDSGDMVETAEAGETRLVLLSGKPIAMFIGDEPFPTIQGLLQFQATRRYVTVDMGAVKFLANGADVMAPGVVDADPGIKEGMSVWVRDEKNLRALVIGTALMDSAQMVSGKGGKAVKTLHFVGDKIWNLSA